MEILKMSELIFTRGNVLEVKQVSAIIKVIICSLAQSLSYCFQSNKVVDHACSGAVVYSLIFILFASDTKPYRGTAHVTVLFKKHPWILIFFTYFVLN